LKKSQKISVTILTITTILLVGFSRMYLGYHFLVTLSVVTYLEVCG